MFRRSLGHAVRCTPLLFQGWGSGGGGSSGGWGASSSAGEGGWGNQGGWGSPAEEPRKERWGGSGFGSGPAPSTEGGWGKNQWSGNDEGWKNAPTGSKRQSNRGNFRRGKSNPGWGSGGGVWGKPEVVDEDTWSAAPPSFTPPVRRVDPLSLTAVEVEIDGIKKLVGQRVQITGLADETSWQTLKDHLRQAGEVVFCRRFSNGRAMVEFSTPEDAARAITELQASELEGATLFLREDREDTVLINTRRKIRDARDAQLRKRKEVAEQRRREMAKAQGDAPRGNEPTA